MWKAKSPEAIARVEAAHAAWKKSYEADQERKKKEMAEKHTSTATFFAVVRFLQDPQGEAIRRAMDLKQPKERKSNETD